MDRRRARQCRPCPLSNPRSQSTRRHSPSIRGPADRARLPRGRLRTLLWVALGAAALYVLVPQLGGLRESLRSLSGVNPLWVLAGLGLVAFRYAMAAVSLQVVVNRPIPFAPTLPVQLASSFVGRLTPESVGWLVLNQRYLERSGIPRASALAAITVKLLAGGLVRLMIAAGVAASVGAAGGPRLDLPPATPYLLAIALVGAICALSWPSARRDPRPGRVGSPGPRDRAPPPAAGGGPAWFDRGAHDLLRPRALDERRRVGNRGLGGQCLRGVPRWVRHRCT